MDFLTPLIKIQVKNSGIIFDTNLKFYRQIDEVVNSSDFQLRTISR